MNKEYWENYYKTKPYYLDPAIQTSTEPSLFAEFVLKNYLSENSSLIELGCGNGRDANFFAKNKINVLAVDMCEDEILSLSKINRYKNLEFICGDFTKLGNIGIFDNVYSRFTLHSVSEKEEDDVIVWAYNHLKIGGKFLIEARSKNNELYGLGDPVLGEPDAYIYHNHYRRFIDTNKLRKKLEKIGFDIILSEEENGFGGSTKQRFFRKIAIKK